MLLDKGDVQTRCIKRNSDIRLKKGLNLRPSDSRRQSAHSVTTHPIEVKRLAVVNRLIFRVLKSKNRPREIRYSTKPVKARLDGGNFQWKNLEALVETPRQHKNIGWMKTGRKKNREIIERAET